MSRAGRGGRIFGILLVTVALVSPVFAYRTAAESGRVPLLLGLVAALLIPGVLLLVHAVRSWRRAAGHPFLTGYREVLELARAHGLHAVAVPEWLKEGGRAGTATSAPASPGPTRRSDAAAPRTATDGTPAKSEDVLAYEREATPDGGHHAEGGCLLIAAGVGGILWAADSGNPAGYAAGVLGLAGLAVWVRGIRRHRRAERLREAALAHLAEVRAAQRAGIAVAELSPPLRRLLDETAGTPDTADGSGAAGPS